MKRGDTYPPLTLNLTDSASASGIDLTAASSVHMEMQNAAKTTLIASMGMVIASVLFGYVKHNWSVAETSMPDTWSLEWEILWANGGIQTVPNDGQKSLQINSDIEGS